MAKAEITTVDGIKVKIQGTPEEVAKIIDHARRIQPATGKIDPKLARRTSAGKRGLPEVLELLRHENFFKDKRGLAAIQGRLSELGSHYSGTTLGKQLLREVRSRRLRRIKDSGKWVYVQ